MKATQDKIQQYYDSVRRYKQIAVSAGKFINMDKMDARAEKYIEETGNIPTLREAINFTK